MRGDAGGLEIVPTGGTAAPRRSGLGNLLMFRRMIAPAVLICIFWLLVVVIILGGLGFAGYVIVANPLRNMGAAIGMAIGALLAIPIYIFLLRLYIEILIVVFRINDNLLDIKEVLERRERG
jgi:hypothetical protein